MSEQCIDDLAIALRDQLILVDDLRDQLEESKANHENAVAHMQVVCAERDQLKLDNSRWRQNYNHLIQQHMPRTGHGCEEGWSRVVEARELQAQVDQLKAENAELRGDVEKAWAAANSECRDWAQEYERRIAAQGQVNQLSLQNAELIDLMRRVVAEHPRRSHKNDGNGPGHGHAIPGVWDSDNGELSGKPCAWCSIWNAAKGIIERHEQATTKEQQ